eukprot:365231-Chlamydomonas_euryale.AAC.7
MSSDSSPVTLRGVVRRGGDGGVGETETEKLCSHSPLACPNCAESHTIGSNHNLMESRHQQRKDRQGQASPPAGIRDRDGQPHTPVHAWAVEA